MVMIKCYIGPMFSGKTAALINMYNRIWHKELVKCFKPKIDDRDYGIIKSRDYEQGIEAYCIKDLSEIVSVIDDKTKTIFIDEVQFLTGDINILFNLSIVQGIDVYVSGLSMTSEQKPFGILPSIMAISDDIEIVKGICYDCNKEANYTYYDGVKDTDILVGNNNYMCLCGNCLAKRKENQHKLIRKRSKN